MKKIILFLIFSANINVYSQTSIGLNTGYSGATYFPGLNVELVLKQKKQNYHFQAGIGAVLFINDLKPALSSYFQFGKQVSPNAKRLFWINEINITYGRKYRADMGSTNGVYICTTVKMALTLNTGLEYQILKRERFNLFSNLKIGFGKAFLVEEVHPEWARPCEKSNHLMSRINLGFLMTYSL